VVGGAASTTSPGWACLEPSAGRGGGGGGGLPLHGCWCACTLLVRSPVARLAALKALGAKKIDDWPRIKMMHYIGYDFETLAEDGIGVMAAPFKALIDVLSKRVKDGWAGDNVLWSSSSFKGRLDPADSPV
jgi:hypothetical protein